VSILVLAYDFSVSQVEPPTSNQVRFNDSLYSNVTRVWARNITTDGADMHVVLLATPPGTDLYVQDKNDSTTFGRFRTVGAPVDKTSYVEFAVVPVDHGANLLNNQAVMMFLITAPEPAPEPTPPGAPLLALADVKEHLRITDTAHDADVQRKASAAEQLVRDYLKTGWLPTWTTGDALPLDVVAAILIVTANLYERRGDEDGPPDVATWDRIGLLLTRRRDPALA